MPPIEQIRALTTRYIAELRSTVPIQRDHALLALLQAWDTPFPDVERPIHVPPGWNLALRLCLEQQTDTPHLALPSGEHAQRRAGLEAWAMAFLSACDRAARIEAVLDEGAAGYRQIEQVGPDTFVAWRTSTQPTVEERERDDFDWWSSRLARSAAVVPTPTGPVPATAPTYPDATDRAFGTAYVARLSSQHSYPPNASIGGATFQRYGEILALLIARLRGQHAGRSGLTVAALYPAEDEDTLVTSLANSLQAEPAAISGALQHFILDRENAPYHAARPGRAAPPLIRLPNGQVALSALGLLAEPFIFLTRELRRRHAQEYHNLAYLREGVFRRDLYGLFADKRFTRSPGRVELRLQGKASTDLDALIFDRKTGTLGVFELKAQDPFARSLAERERQRDNFFHANQQVSVIAQWVQRHGGGELLARFDARTAKQYQVQKTHIFVLGRYLAHFSGGPTPDRRAAWGSWVDLLRLTNGHPAELLGRSPLGTLFDRLRAPAPRAAIKEIETIDIPGLRLTLFPSYAAYRAGTRPD